MTPRAPAVFEAEYPATHLKGTQPPSPLDTGTPVESHKGSSHQDLRRAIH